VEGQGAAPYTVTPTRPARRANGATAAGAKGGQPALAPLILRVAGDLLDGYVARRRLRDGTPTEIHTALMADGGELREEAIRTVGERKLHEEAPTLLKLLEDPDEPTRDAALGSLIALGDRRAVSVLTRGRSLRDRHEMRKIIEAIAILGGQEADDYLSFVADTHDDEEIRSAASRARARISHHDVDSGAR
jgi:HEAT repeat protein